MSTKRKKEVNQTVLSDWTLGVIHWIDPTLDNEAEDADVAITVSVAEHLANQFTFGVWRRDDKGDYVIYSSICVIDDTLQFDQRTLIPKVLVQKALDFVPKD